MVLLFTDHRSLKKYMMKSPCRQTSPYILGKTEIPLVKLTSVYGMTNKEYVSTYSVEGLASSLKLCHQITYRYPPSHRNIKETNLANEKDKAT